MAEEKKKKRPHAGHGFKHTHIEHHHDGSHTVHHQHEDGEASDKKHAAADLDGVHDSMEDHLNPEGNPGEAEADAGQHGVPDEQAAAAGLPGQAASGGAAGASGAGMGGV